MMLLALFANNAYAYEKDFFQSSNVEKPEFVYSIHTAADDYIDNWWGAITDPQYHHNRGLFAFFAVKGDKPYYKIRCVSNNTWLTYEKNKANEDGRDKVFPTSDENNAGVFKLTFTQGTENARGKEGFLISPVGPNDNITDYLNWFGGASDNNGVHLGLWCGGAKDANSLWQFELERGKAPKVAKGHSESDPQTTYHIYGLDSNYEKCYWGPTGEAAGAYYHDSNNEFTFFSAGLNENREIYKIYCPANKSFLKYSSANSYNNGADKVKVEYVKWEEASNFYVSYRRGKPNATGIGGHGLQGFIICPVDWNNKLKDHAVNWYGGIDKNRYGYLGFYDGWDGKERSASFERDRGNIWFLSPVAIEKRKEEVGNILKNIKDIKDKYENTSNADIKNLLDAIDSAVGDVASSEITGLGSGADLEEVLKAINGSDLGVNLDADGINNFTGQYDKLKELLDKANETLTETVAEAEKVKTFDSDKTYIVDFGNNGQLGYDKENDKVVIVQKPGEGSDGEGSIGGGSTSDNINTEWEIIEKDDHTVVLKDPETGNYLGKDEDGKVVEVKNEADATEFEYEKDKDGNVSFKEKDTNNYLKPDTNGSTGTGSTGTGTGTGTGSSGTVDAIIGEITGSGGTSTEGGNVPTGNHIATPTPSETSVAKDKYDEQVQKVEELKQKFDGSTDSDIVEAIEKLVEELEKIKENNRIEGGEKPAKAEDYNAATEDIKKAIDEATEKIQEAQRDGHLPNATVVLVSDFIAPSTDASNPENVYHIGSNNNSAYFWGNGTKPASNATGYAFFPVEGKEDVYKIYSVGDGKWLTYDKQLGYNDGPDFIKLADDEKNAGEFKIEFAKGSSNANGIDGFLISPHNYLGAEDKYLNWHGGINSNTNKAVGLYSLGDTDKGSIWTITPAKGEHKQEKDRYEDLIDDIRDLIKNPDSSIGTGTGTGPGTGTGTGTGTGEKSDLSKEEQDAAKKDLVGQLEDTLRELIDDKSPTYQPPTNIDGLKETNSNLEKVIEDHKNDILNTLYSDTIGGLAKLIDAAQKNVTISLERITRKKDKILTKKKQAK